MGRARIDLVPVVAVLAVLAAGCATPRPLREGWVRVATANFELYSDASSHVAQSLADTLERFDRVVRAVEPGLAEARPRAPVLIFVFARAGGFQRAGGTDTDAAIGQFEPFRDANFLVITGASESDATQTAFHEYTHLLLHASGRQTFPIWYHEGLAELLSRARLGETTVELGGMGRIEWWSASGSEAITVRRLLELRADGDSALPVGASFHARAWAFTHFLRVGEPEREGQLRHYLALWDQGRPAAAACREAFGSDPDQLERLLRDYLKKQPDAVRTFDVRPAQGPPAAVAHQIGADVVAAWLGRMLVRAEELPARNAERLFRFAVAVDPRNALAHAGLGLVRQREGALSDAEAHLLEALALDATGARVLADYGHYELARARSAPAASAESRVHLDRACDAFRKALARAPGDGDGLYGLGSCEAQREPGSNRGLELLEEAGDALPQDADVAFALAELYAARNQRSQAILLLERVMRSYAPPSRLREASNRLRALGVAPSAP